MVKIAGRTIHGRAALTLRIVARQQRPIRQPAPSPPAAAAARSRTPCRPTLSFGEAGGDLAERRPRPILGRMNRPADMDKTGDAFVLLEAERVEHAAVIGVPFGDPVGAIAERVG